MEKRRFKRPKSPNFKVRKCIHCNERITQLRWLEEDGTYPRKWFNVDDGFEHECSPTVRTFSPSEVRKLNLERGLQV